MQEPDSSQQCQLPRQEAMGTSKTHETPSENRKTLFLLEDVPRVVVESPSLEIFKTQLVTVLGNPL